MRRLVLPKRLPLGLIPLMPGAKRILRRALRATVQWVMALRSRPLSSPSGPILVIAPHLDDCTLGCSGLLFQARLAGENVHIIYLTDGAASYGDNPLITPDQLATTRKREALEAKSRLYVDSACMYFMNLPDGRVPHRNDEKRDAAVTDLARHIRQITPSVVLLPLRKDGSTEHEAGFSLVTAALAQCSLRPRVLEYPVWANYRPVHLIRPALFATRLYRFRFNGYGSHKRHALNAYVSQFQPTPAWRRPVMPEEFTGCFTREDEFFFEQEA